MSIVDVGSGLFVAKFNLTEDHKFILSNGPWMIFYHYRAIQPWIPNFDLDMATVNKVATWVYILHLLMK